ncbi:MAG TPA: C4-type zinc ribbon domain-containing protein [Vicinamibacteria bacterium]|jgi:predicted  nucleic acid-binding Zn-ribbon protein|nr:C4-type zinc ribbon domain-containing protein [Vicinamibacteria bacterium]
MNADLEKLVRLHHAEASLKSIESDLAEVPRLRKEIEDRLERDRSHLDAAKAALAGSQKARKEHESAVADLKAKLSKYKGQLMEVKTNKEYTAVLHEIEGVERDIRTRDDLTFGEMEKEESLTQEVKREEADFKALAADAAKEKADLDARAAALGAEASRKQSERDAAAASIPEEALALYARVAKQRGSGVAEAREGMCQACHVRMRLQVWVEVKKNEQVLQCESCSRILYFEPPPPTVVAEP